MNAREARILSLIENDIQQSDAALAARLAAGPRLTTSHKVGLAAAVVVGTSLVMMFSANLMFGVAGYLILVAAGTTTLRQRPLQPAHESPLELVHRLTAGLFRNTHIPVESGHDWE